MFYIRHMKKIILPWLLFLVVVHTSIFAQQLPFTQYALKGVNIVDVDNNRILENYVIVIGDKKIRKTIPAKNYQTVDSIPTITLNGKYVIPGLIDTHVHLETEFNSRTKTEQILKDMLCSGITTIRDMANDTRVLSLLSKDALLNDITSPDIVYSAILAGPEFFKAPKAIATCAGGKSGEMPYMRAVTKEDDIRLIIANAKGTGATGVKLYYAIDADLAAKITAEAKKQGMLVWAHTAILPAMPMDVINAEVNVMSHAEMFYYHRINEIPKSWRKVNDDQDFWDKKVDSLKLDELFIAMKKKGILLDATNLAFVNMIKKEPYKKWRLLLSQSVTKRAYKSGVKICTGSDSDQEIFIQEEIILLVKDCGFTTMDAIKSSTIYAAEASGILNTHGSIAEGKVANMVVLNKNPIENINNIKEVDFVIKSGWMHRKNLQLR